LVDFSDFIIIFFVVGPELCLAVEVRIRDLVFAHEGLFFFHNLPREPLFTAQAFYLDSVG
jgi:hypothetical protein